jgi:8-oxo-dGTP pyrophosphatase MutT (NUDIX family)
MHRQHLNELLARYAAAWPAETEIARRFADFVHEHADCLLRTCAPGHITASAWIVDARGERALLTHHRKLGRWLQLGGHVDGEQQVERAALREAQEESGMRVFRFLRWLPELVPIDLDVHGIPARRGEPAHEHWDVRFWLQAEAGQDIVRSDESNDLRWFAAAELAAATVEESVLRLARKTARLAPRAGFPP